MMEILGVELSKAGLSINGAKTKILTTNSDAISSQIPTLLDIGDFFVEVVRRDGCHKYLGRKWSGDLRIRGQCNLEHRLSLSWFKFQQFTCSTKKPESSCSPTFEVVRFSCFTYGCLQLGQHTADRRTAGETRCHAATNVTKNCRLGAS